MSNLHAFDLVVIAGYFLVLLGIGYWAARREKNVSADYFLASRDVGWFAVGEPVRLEHRQRASRRPRAPISRGCRSSGTC